MNNRIRITKGFRPDSWKAELITPTGEAHVIPFDMLTVVVGESQSVQIRLPRNIEMEWDLHPDVVSFLRGKEEERKLPL